MGTAVDWAYTTVAQARAGGRAFVLNRGKMLGGSTCVPPSPSVFLELT